MVISKKGAAQRAPPGHSKHLVSTCCGPGIGVHETWGAWSSLEHPAPAHQKVHWQCLPWRARSLGPISLLEAVTLLTFRFTK